MLCHDGSPPSRMYINGIQGIGITLLSPHGGAMGMGRRGGGRSRSSGPLGDSVPLVPKIQGSTRSEGLVTKGSAVLPRRPSRCHLALQVMVVMWELQAVSRAHRAIRKVIICQR